MRRGMPTSQDVLLQATKKRAAKLEAKGKQVDHKGSAWSRDCGVTNVRNTASRHWRRWLAPHNRVPVPFTSFSEFEATTEVNVRSAADENRPLLRFAGI
jgi:putative SOS response-associated peptidase YedK